MTSLRVSATHQPLSSGSQPPSPAEEDIAKVAAWDEEDTSTLVSPQWKGKGKQREDDDDDDDDGTVNGDNFQREADDYPPMAEDELEARKVEQNLKRWETMEKQRRKKARESRLSSKSDTLSSSSSFSVVDVSRRASQLWNGRSRERPKAPTDRAHPHQVLEDVDESLAMDETGPPSAVSPADTPRTSVADTVRFSSEDIANGNPFENPQYAESAAVPGALMRASSTNSLPTTPKGVPNGEPERPILQVPPPRPLNLPAPATPPPQLVPGAVPRRTQQAGIQEDFEDGRMKRWWTEWLCGCREDAADQAGRTNPME